MGKKLDALLGRSFKPPKFRATVNVAISRVTVLKNQRQARCSIARSDVVQLLHLNHHERALLRVDQVTKEQNMLDVYAILESYCQLLIERINLIGQESVCPEELKEATSSLIFASTRVGEFPELQEIRAVLTSRYGKDFAARAIELRNNCGVNPQIIQKLSTKQASLDSRMKMLKEIASENGVVLQLEDASSGNTEERMEVDQNRDQPKPDRMVNSGGSAELEDDSPVLDEDVERVTSFTDSMKARRKYRDVADAAQAAFESAAYAAAAARAAVELSRSESQDPDDQDKPSPRQRKVPNTQGSMKSEFQSGEEKDIQRTEDLNVGSGYEKIHPAQHYHSESEDEEVHIENNEGLKQNKNAEEFQRSISLSSSDSADNNLMRATLSSAVEDRNKPVETGIFFDESDDETGNKPKNTSLSRKHDLGFNTNEVLGSAKSSTFKNEDFSDGSGAKTYYYTSQKQFHARSQTGLKVDSPVNHISPSAGGSKRQDAQNLNAENKRISVRTRRVYGR
ncbi:hypothetical protein RJ639_034530 [Escallonia herrerae]|uniref:Uncharacterized protein n=1 Tax=Escallonia herrerae TaxID=1293975 RepID=A0AA88WT88_9ASTE|nr:hypothetical protein RJ639_034530 [Escallonia herrerae]